MHYLRRVVYYYLRHMKGSGKIWLFVNIFVLSCTMIKKSPKQYEKCKTFEVCLKPFFTITHEVTGS